MKSKNKITTIVGLAGAGALAFLLIKNANANNENQDAYEDDTDTDNLSYKVSTYYTLATKLREAMDRFGTDDAAVLAAIRMLKNKDDYNKLYTVFGNHKPSIWSWNAGQLDTGDLNEWLLEDLRDNFTTLKLVKEHLNSINVVL